MALELKDLEILRAPFLEEKLGVKIQSTSKDRTKCMLVCYLQHTDVQERLEQVDPSWTCETLKEERIGDTVYVRMKMTLKGVSRENVGEGWDTKAAHSDAVKRCAMLFGVGRYLYDTVTVWAPYNEQSDKFKIFTYADYERYLKEGQPGVPMAEAEPKEGIKPKAESRASGNGHKKSEATVKQTDFDKQRKTLEAQIMKLYRPFMAKYPDVQFSILLNERYGVKESAFLNPQQLEDFASYLEAEVNS